MKKRNFSKTGSTSQYRLKLKLCKNKDSIESCGNYHTDTKDVKVEKEKEWEVHVRYSEKEGTVTSRTTGHKVLTSYYF